MVRSTTNSSKTFCLVMIKPSHYDDDGYVIQWLRSAIPSNTLAVLNGLAIDCAERKVLGDDVDLVLSTFDETNTRIKPQNIIRQIRQNGGRGLVALVGVQSNQFPRAVDIAVPLSEAGIPVCIGGFHVSGCLSMLPELPVDIRQAQDKGISMFAGEAEEGRLDQILRDAYSGTLKPLYNFMDNLPGLVGVPTPILPRIRIKRTAGAPTSFDAGRGCPFQCSFCTIINVQGRKSRYRSTDDIERIVRDNMAQGIRDFFITDDNFARNKDWESVFDRLIKLREQDGLRVHCTIQVDTMCHKIPNFIKKAGRAGVTKVFIGLESINTESLIGAKKRQNRISEYRRMLLDWKSIGAITYAGYILGFPTDTPESIIRDIRIIQRELPLDLLEFFYLTPLPGSEDHQKLWQKGVWMDGDLNKYDLNHVTAEHPLMSRQDWERVYQLAWETYYTPEHMETVMRRAEACSISAGKMMFLMVWFYGCITVEKLHPLEGGFFRLKFRKDRRSTLPIESPFLFYPRYAWESLTKVLRLLWLVWTTSRMRARVKNDPKRREYTDLALSPVTDDDYDKLELFTVSSVARAEVEKKRQLDAKRAALTAAD